MPYTVGVCGYSGTGSSAVADLLKEYAENQVIDICEFILPYEPDGLLDLEYHLFSGSVKFSSSNTAIGRFRKAIRGPQFRHIRKLTQGRLISLSEDYLQKIVECSWIGSKPGEDCNKPIYDIGRRLVYKFKLGMPYHYLESKLQRELRLFPLGKMWYSSHPDGFYEATREFVYEVLNSIEPIVKTKNIVLDQPYPGNNPQICFPFFENPKAIVVDRDPRDLYLLSKEFWFELQAWRPLPTHSVEDFIKYYRSMRQATGVEDPDKILRVRFEDLVYRYDETRMLIESFLALGDNGSPKVHFDPSKSINNTQLFKHYQDYEDDIARIEHELPEYLFPFEDFSGVEFNRANMFE